MTVTIRDGDPGEARALEALQRRASLVWDDHRDDLVAHPDAIEVPASLFADGDVRLAVDDEVGTVGFSIVLPVTAFAPDDPARAPGGLQADGPAGTTGAAELDGLFVEPDWQRGRGIGRALVDDAAARAAARGDTRLLVIGNANALGFYEKVGFTLLGEVPTRFGPGLRMVRPLP